MNSTKKTDKLTLSVEEMAQLLGIGTSKAYALTRQIDFPVLKLGKRVLVPVEELQIWIKQNVRKFKVR